MASGSAGTKLALVVVPSETVSMGLLDEHARPSTTKFEGFFGHHTALYRKKAVSRCEGRSASIRIYKCGRPHPFSGTGLSGSSSWTTLDRAEFKIGCKFTTESWYGVAAPYERTEANMSCPLPSSVARSAPVSYTPLTLPTILRVAVLTVPHCFSRL